MVCTRLLSVVDALAIAGIDCPVYGIGSTPTCSCALDSLFKLTEVHPGNYAFYDLQQMLLNSCHVDDIACKVATRVIGHYPDRDHLLVDCGFTAFTTQGYSQDLGYGLIENEPDLKLVAMSQEIGKIKSRSGNLDFFKYPIGKMLFVYPYHSCATSAMHPVYYVHKGNAIIEKWIPTRGWWTLFISVSRLFEWFWTFNVVQSASMFDFKIKFNNEQSICIKLISSFLIPVLCRVLFADLIEINVTKNFCEERWGLIRITINICIYNIM